MAWQQGLSGLNASSKALDVVGNNIANASTVGFKSSAGHFADLYAASMNGSGIVQIGIGTQLAAVFQQFTTGNITTTNNPLDIAINGGGFFNVTRDGEVMYTRNGQFHADNQGYIINDQDYRLMGYPVSANGQIVMTQPVPIQLDTANVAPRATGSALGGDLRMVLNLDSSKDAPSVTPFNYQNPLTIRGRPRRRFTTRSAWSTNSPISSSRIRTHPGNGTSMPRWMAPIPKRWAA